MSREFIRRKAVWIELGITDVTLHKRINAGYYPPLEIEKDGSFRKGYFADTLEKVKKIKTTPRGRPTK